tara:strand:+ start:139 stop:2385 length:2247 start_codon:yes stop_codon:yes gene_type:complete
MKNFPYIFRLFFIFLLLFNSSYLFASNLIINGNKNSDVSVIISLIGSIPETDNSTKSNYILKKLNDSDLFKSVEISYDDNNFYITIEEYPAINKIYYKNNERIKDEEIDTIAKELNILTLSDKNINKFVDELKNIYQSFGFNNIDIQTSSLLNNDNSSDLYLNFNEGSITKINNISINGNLSFDTQIILSKIKSKTKSLTNIFANNNFKIFEINNDLIRIKDFYKSKGYRDINVNFDVDYFKNNKVDVNFNIIEGKRYYFNTLKINNKLDVDKNINDQINNFLNQHRNFYKINYNLKTLDNIESQIAEILEYNGKEFYEIIIYEKIEKEKVDIIYEIINTQTKYVNQINIIGNTRTFDYVIRREISISEGDPITDTKIKQINRHLNQLSIFSNIDIERKSVNNDFDDLVIEVEETQTGSFNVGLSIDSLEGPSFVSGLKEKNLNGTGRSLEFLINTSDNNRAFTLSTTEKFILNNDINHKYSLVYNENDFSKAKSYKLNSFELDTSFKYLFSNNLYHTFGVGYSIKDYIVTNSSTVSNSINTSSGESISFNINNDLTYNSLNSFLKPTKGQYISFGNLIETPSSSSNGFIKNIVTYKRFFEKDNNIYSVQSKIGNVFSLNDSEILSDNKFSLGGRWLRGFDNFGAGPRNSRTAYVGGNNLFVTKFDFSRPLTLNDQNPIYLNLFNDYGLVWENKNSVTSSDQSLRSSYGFGINYYSPIGPIGFSWAFPITSKDYDIERMFLFTIGNLN